MSFLERMERLFRSSKESLFKALNLFLYADAGESRRRILRSVHGTLGNLKKTLALRLPSNLRTIYSAADAEAVALFEKAKAAGILGDLKAPPEEKVRNALGVLTNDFFKNLDPGLNSIHSLAIRLSRRAALERTLKKLGYGDIEVGKEVLSKSWESGFLDLPCSDGRTRSYDLEYYGKLLSISVEHRTQTMATLLRSLQNDQDLVRVTKNPSKFGDFCDAYRGRVFSISGKSEIYPPLSKSPNNGPPFHPHCYHRLEPFIEDLASGAELELARSMDHRFLLQDGSDSAGGIQKRWEGRKKSKKPL